MRRIAVLVTVAAALTAGLITQPTFPKVAEHGETYALGVLKGPGGPPDPGPIG
jgi:hypothetical protein